MIDALAATLRDTLISPQTGAGVDAVRRLYVDPDHVPVDAHPQTAEVIAVSTTPIRRVIGTPGVIVVRHEVAVGVIVEHGDRAEAMRRRGLILSDIVGRLLAIDWPNVVPGYEADDWTVTYDEADAVDALAAYGTLRLTVDVEVRP